MEDTPRTPPRAALIDGETFPLASSSTDAATDHVRLTLIQRGSRTIERLQALMSRQSVELAIPGQEPFRAVPHGIDVTTTRAGAATIYRIDLTFEQLEPASVVTVPDPDAPDPLAARLDQIEAKLDRILALLAPETTAPGA